MGSNARGALFSLLAFGVFSTHDVVVKILGGAYTPFQILFFAALFTFPLVTLMLIWDETPGHLRPVHPWWTLLRTCCATTATLCAFYAFSVLPLAQTYAILFAAPLIITLLSIPILGERVGWYRGMAIIVGLAGVLVVLRPGSSEFGLGHLAALSVAVFSSLASVIIRKIGRDERPVVLILYPVALNFLVAAALLPMNYVPMPGFHLILVACISALGFTAGLFLIGAYRRAEATVVAPMQYSQIIWASLFGWFFFQETADTPTYFGAAIIIASGLFIVLREGRKGASSNRPVLRNRARGFGSSFRVSPFVDRK